MELEIRDLAKSVDFVDSNKLVVSDAVFRYPFNTALVHQVVSTYLTNSRQGTKSQKGRADVSGSNKKPWRQKGTGRARSGSTKSPIWRSGGVTFAAIPKLYDQKVNKKMYRRAIRSILSRLVYDNRLFVIKNLYLEKPKTKLLLERLQKIASNKSILIFTDIVEHNLFLAARNVYRIKVRPISCIDPVSLINFNITLLTDTTVKQIEKRLI